MLIQFIVVTLACYSTGMYVDINPYENVETGSFDGSIYLRNDDNFTISESFTSVPDTCKSEGTAFRAQLVYARHGQCDPGEIVRIM